MLGAGRRESGRGKEGDRAVHIHASLTFGHVQCVQYENFAGAAKSAGKKEETGGMEGRGSKLLLLTSI